MNRDALLARLWTLASFPLEPTPLDPHKEEINTFIEACVRPEDGTVNIDVVKSIIPKAYQVDDSVAIDDLGGMEVDQVSTKSLPQNVYILPPRVAAPKQPITLNELCYQIQAQPISKLLAMNHKSPTTDAFKTSLLEGKLLLTFSRMEELKQNERWSAKQIKRFEQPKRLNAHFDHLLNEMKHVRNGKTGDRRLKMYTCYLISNAILDHFNKIETKFKNETLLDGLPSNLNKINLEIVKQLPLEPTFTYNYKEQITNDVDLVPVSKFLTPVTMETSFKRCIIEDINKEVIEEEEFNDVYKVKFKQKRENDIRPPQPPPIRYITSRLGSAWHQQDDQLLLKLVRQFQNNWDLIATNLHSFQTFTSNVERRTPWQVFERYVLLAQVDLKELKGKHADQARQWLEASKTTLTARKRQMPVTLAQDAYLRGHQRLRWASVLEGIRKVKRKRETVQKPQPASFVSRQRPDVSQQKMYTAKELSQVRIESDRKAAEQAMQQRMRPMGIMPQQQQQQLRQQNEMAPQLHPSIAGLPLPPSVAAAARMQQMKAQQQQQQSNSAQLMQNRFMQSRAQQQQQQIQQMRQRQATPQQQERLSPQQAQQLRMLQAQRMQNRQRPPFTREQLHGLMNQIAQSNPGLSQGDVQKMAVERMRKYMQSR